MAYYTPSRVGYWICRYALLEALAETPSSARHALRHDESDQRPCLDHPRPTARSGFAGDPLRYADILADIDSAHAAIGTSSREWQIIELRRRHGSVALGRIAQILRIRKQDCCQAWRSAVTKMAAVLDPEPESF